MAPDQFWQEFLQASGLPPETRNAFILN